MKCTSGFHLHGAWKVRGGGNGDMEVHTAHIRHQFQVGADLHTGEKCNRIKLQNLSPLSSVTVKSWLNIQNAKSRLHFFLLLNLRKIHKFLTISKSGCFPLVNQRNWGAHPITTPRSEFLDSSCCVHFLQCQNNHSWSLLKASMQLKPTWHNSGKLNPTSKASLSVFYSCLRQAQKNIHIVCLYNSTSAGQTEELKFSTNNNRGLLHVYSFLVWFGRQDYSFWFWFEDFHLLQCWSIAWALKKLILVINIEKW